jgi:Tfp pilus assembly protein PilF
MSDVRDIPSPTAAPRRPLLGFIAIALLTLAVHGVDVTHRFVGWDDDLLVTRNELLNPVTPQHLGRFWTGPVQGLYSPLAYTTWAAVTPLARTADVDGISLSPAPFHALNVLLHACCALLVLAILLRLTAGHTWAATIGAGVFAVHPLQVEAVAWVSGMNNLLAGVFSLACIAAYVRAFPPLPRGESAGVREEPPRGKRSSEARRRGTSHPSPPPSPRWGEGVWYVAACGFLVLAMLSKPTAIVTPILLAVIDLAVLRRPAAKVAVGIAPLLLLAIPFAIVGRYAQEASTVFSPTLPQRLLVAGDAVGWYLGKLAWPWPLHIDYGRTPESVVASGGSLAGWLAVAIAGVVAAVTFRRWRWVAGSLGVFVAGMGLVIGLVPFDFQTYSTVADRYAYLSLLGAAMGVAMLLSRAPRPALALAAIGIVALAVLSVRQSLVWRSTETLIAHQARHHPDSLAAHAIQAGLANLRGDPTTAEAHYRAGLRLRPTDITLNTNLGNLLRETGRPAESLVHYQAAFDAGERKPLLFNNWGLSLFALKLWPEAEDAFRAALAADPSLYNGHMNLGRVLANRGKFAESAHHFREALRLKPDSAEAREALAKVTALQRQ